ncbi:MAG: hypothetical protein MR945_04595 [Agathobacter sp.]|nr:hypothetical protein [Agathobacter sp.]
MLRELVFATVIAEIKNAFVDEISDPDLIELLYRGVAEPLGIQINKVQKGAASKIVNREPGGKPLRIIKGHSQDAVVKSSIGAFFKKNVTCHFMPDMEEEIIFHIRGVIKEDGVKISDSKKDEMLRLGKKETFDDFLGQVYLYSLTRDNVLGPEAKERLNIELEEYKRHPLEDSEIPDAIIKKEREYITALEEIYAQAEKMPSFSLDNIANYPKYERHLREQRKYYFAAEAVRRGTRDIYDEESQFDILKSETYEFVKEDYEDSAKSGMDRLRTVQKRAGELNSSRCWLFRDTDWIGVPQKKGVCHFLVKDGSIEGWVRDDDEAGL